jgi:RHS repeat-associated protein
MREGFRLSQEERSERMTRTPVGVPRSFAALFVVGGLLLLAPMASGQGAATPTFSPTGGTYSSTQSVTISTTTSGAQIVYTTDGSTPTKTHGTQYGGAITVASTTTINAIAFVPASIKTSSVGSATYTINPPVATPTFSPTGGTYTSTQSVTIGTTTSGATIRYTIDGSTPSETHGTVYSSAISVASATTINAIAYESGYTDSSVASASYTITPPVATPTFSPTGGTYTSTQSVTIGTTTSGATIRYTIDGSTPSETHGTVYGSAISVASTMTINAIAYETGYTDSSVASATYTITPAALNYVTTYTYDLMNHLTGVSMTRPTGTQTRTFVYSGNLLMSATNPENGAVSYTFNSYQKVATRTDAKGQQTVYTYDTYARLTKVQRYPQGASGAEDTCQQEDYYYDGASPSNSTYPTNAQGHLSAVQYWGAYNAVLGNPCDTTFTELYNYGTPGAPVGKQLQISRAGVSQTITLTAGFTYDTEGRMTGETYPTDANNATANLGYTFDSMGRLNTMTDNIANQTVITGATYGPANELLTITGGSSPGSWGYGGNGETRTYNSLKQLTGISSGTYVQPLSIAYAYPATNNNGKIASQTDGVTGETVTYAYDALNRLASAATQSNFSTPWGQSFTYDGFGNLTNVNVTQGSAPAFAAGYDANNHGSVSVDANGNPSSIPVPADGANSSATYDVENRLAAVGGSIYYSYAPGNKRIWRGNATRSTDEITFWSVSGQKLADYALTTTTSTFYATQTETNYYFGSKLIKNINGWVYSDRLASVGKFYPYGIERPSATTNGTEKFTGYFRDAETGNDYAMNRYESPGYGRFLTPDPASQSFRVADPGSFNKYAYTRGDPVNRFDSQGTDDDDSDCIGDICYLIDESDPVNTNCFAAVGLQPTDPLFQQCFAGSDPTTPPPQPAPQPECDIELFTRPTPSGGPAKGWGNHTYIYITGTDFPDSNIFPGGFMIEAGPVNGKLTGMESAPGQGLAAGKWNASDPMNPSNKEVGTPYTGADACALVGTLLQAVSSYDSGPEQPYAFLGTTNSNAFTFTLLSDIGLETYFGHPPGFTPGWGNTVDGLTLP